MCLTWLKLILICQTNLLWFLCRINTTQNVFLLHSMNYTRCFWRHRNRLLQSFKVIKLTNFLFWILVTANILYQIIFWTYLVVTSPYYCTIILYRQCIVTFHSTPILSFTCEWSPITLGVANWLVFLITVLIDFISILLLGLCKVICCFLKNNWLHFLWGV